MMKEGEKDEENSIELMLLLMVFDSCVHRKRMDHTTQPARASFPALSLEPRNMFSLTLRYILAPGTMNCTTRTLPREGALSWTPGDKPIGLHRDT